MTNLPPEEEALTYDPLDDQESFEPKPLPTGGPQEDFSDLEDE